MLKLILLITDNENTMHLILTFYTVFSLNNHYFALLSFSICVFKTNRNRIEFINNTYL